MRNRILGAKRTDSDESIVMWRKGRWMSDIFISYAEADRDIAEQIGVIIPGFGYSTWFYHRDFIPGVLHLETTKQQIELSSVVILLISRASLSSDFVFPEVLHAVAQRKPIIPVLIDLAYGELEREKPRWVTAIGFSVAVPWGSGDEALMAILRGLVALLGQRERPELDINAKDEKGYTALAVALIACDESDPEDVRKRTEIVNLLLQHGADPNIASHDGTTPLVIAQRKGLGDIEMVLRGAGALR